MNRSTLTPAFQLSISAALSAWIALTIAQLMQLQYPLYALIGAIIVTDLEPLQSRRLALQRLAGTLLGALVGASLIQFIPTSAELTGVGILASMLLSHVLRLEGTAKVTGYVCAIVMLEHEGHAWFYAFHRVLETIIGIAVAFLVSLVPKIIPEGAAGRNDS